jgi:hypothetical protein
MSFYEFKSVPHQVEGLPVGLRKLPKYRNLMFEKKVFTGLASKGIADLVTKGTASSKVPNLSTATVQTLDKNRFKATEAQEATLALTPRAKAGFLDSGTLTEEYVEDLSSFYPTQSKSCQTDSLLNRAIRGQNITTPKGESIGTQIERTDYLIDFDEQVGSVVRVLLNKVLEEGRMEVLEELELEKIAQQKSRAHQDKLKALSRLQRAQFREDRISCEVEKRRYQNELGRKKSEAAHKKLCARNLSKRVIAMVQTEFNSTSTEVTDYVDVAACRIYTDFMPLLTDEVSRWVEEHQALDLVSRKMAGDCLTHLTEHHRQSIGAVGQQ